MDSGDEQKKHDSPLVQESANQQSSQISPTNLFQEIPIDYLIPFMKEALQLSRRVPEATSNTEIKDDLIEGPDNRDYIRLLNIRFLLEIPRDRFDTRKRLQWILNLSRQIDALNIHDGSLRDIMRPLNNDGIFWRRLAYLHHGLSLESIAPIIKEYIVSKIFESSDLLDFQRLIITFFDHNIYAQRSETSQIRAEWLNRVSTILAWPSLAPNSWFCESIIPLKERIYNFYSLLKKRKKQEFRDKDEEQEDYIMIHPYFKAGAHPNKIVKGFTESVEKIKCRARAINDESYDKAKFEGLQQEIKELTAQINHCQNNIRKLKKMLPEKQEELEEQVRHLSEFKQKREEKEKDKDIYARSVELVHPHVTELMEDLKKFGSAQLEVMIADYAKYLGDVSSVSFDNILFYIGLINEYEHLSIANEYFRILKDKNFDPDVILQGIAVIAEALNNTFLPAMTPEEDIASFKEIFRFLRNRTIEHKNQLSKQKMKELLQSVEKTAIFEEIYKDLEFVEKKISSRFERMKSLMQAEDDWKDAIEELKTKLSIKPKRSKEIEWENVGIPSLSGLVRYFKYRDYALAEILIANNTQIGEIRQRIKNKEASYSTEERNRDNTESSTLFELQEYIREVDILIGDLNAESLKKNLEKDLSFRLKFIRLINDTKESFSYLAENMDHEYLSQVSKVLDEEVLWHLYYDLQERRNLVTHDLWRSDVNGLISTALRIQNILKPAVMRISNPKDYIVNLGKNLEATKALFQHLNRRLSISDLEEINLSSIEDLIRVKQADVNGIDPEGCTPLFHAIKKDNKNLVQFLLEAGANPNVVDRHGNTLLHLILNDDHYNKTITQLLIQYGAISDTRNAEGETPYRTVLKRMPKEVRRRPLYLLPNVKDEDSPYRILEDLRKQHGYQRGLEADRLHTELRMASSKDAIEKLRELVEEGYDINLYDEHGEILLCLALGRHFASEDCCAFLELFLSQESTDPNRQNYIGIQQAALHLAAQRRSLEPLRIILRKREANISIQNAEKETPLHYAVGLRNFNGASLLIKEGADLHARNFDELTPILVCAPNQLEMLKLLLSNGANPNDRAPNSGTLLEGVEQRLDNDGNLPSPGHIVSLFETRQLLLQHGAYPIVRMTPTISTTIAYCLMSAGLSKNPQKRAAMQSYQETYNFSKLSMRFDTFLFARNRFYEALDVEKEKNKLVREKIKNYKKFIIAVGSPKKQNQVEESIIKAINAENIPQIEKNQLLQLISGQEGIMADAATESLQCLVTYKDTLKDFSQDDSDDDSVKEFRQDFEQTQLLLGDIPENTHRATFIKERQDFYSQLPQSTLLPEAVIESV